MAKTRAITDPSCHACGDPIRVKGKVVLYHPGCDPVKPPTTHRLAKRLEAHGNRAIHRALIQTQHAHLVACKLADHYAAGVLHAVMRVLEDIRID